MGKKEKKILEELCGITSSLKSIAKSLKALEHAQILLMTKEKPNDIGLVKNKPNNPFKNKGEYIVHEYLKEKKENPKPNGKVNMSHFSKRIGVARNTIISYLVKHNKHYWKL